jgi:chorismate mutase
MPSSEQTLAKLRREIDEIDDDMHDLLMRRSSVVEKVRSLKGGDTGSYLRPAREAVIVRRLVNRGGGRFPKPALVRIWREIMAALVRLQGPFAVAVFAPDDHPGYWDLARDHFGASTPLAAHGSVGQVMRAVNAGEASVGVLPWPHEASPDPWWRHLASEEEDALRIVARLPFAGEANGRAEGLSAVAVARMAQEHTGRDRSLIIIETAGETSRSRLVSAMEADGLEPGFVAEWQDSADPNTWLRLVEIAQFVAPDDPRMGLLRERSDGSITRVMQVGGYAEPLGADELAEPGGDAA